MNFWSGRTFPNQISISASASRKFLKFRRCCDIRIRRVYIDLSFSEPKIPQRSGRVRCQLSARSISASASRKFLMVGQLRFRLALCDRSQLQRAENSSIATTARTASAPQCDRSQLQRAENSSIAEIAARLRDEVGSISASASRKFLKHPGGTDRCTHRESISASASRKFLNCVVAGVAEDQRHIDLSFSEPKIPQSPSAMTTSRVGRVSISASASRKFLKGLQQRSRHQTDAVSISASASRKFLNPPAPRARAGQAAVSISASASRKFLNLLERHQRLWHVEYRSQLQRAENSSIFRLEGRLNGAVQKSISASASRKFLKRPGRPGADRPARIDLSFSEPKIPQKRVEPCREHQETRIDLSFSEPKIPQSDPRTCVHPYFRPR